MNVRNFIEYGEGIGARGDEVVFVMLSEEPCRENGYYKIEFLCRQDFEDEAETAYFAQLESMRAPVHLIKKEYVGPPSTTLNAAPESQSADSVRRDCELAMRVAVTRNRRF